MYWFIILLAAGAAGAWLYPLVEFLLHPGSIESVTRMSIAKDAGLPSVSIVLAARDEANAIEPAMRSLLALDYPNLEIIAVNDRSTDATGEILARLAAEDSRLRIVTINRLPEGWLGKNHALHQGGQAATGKYILFTDADVHLDPHVLRRAIPWAGRNRIDHLVIGADVLARGWLERALLGFFMCIFMIHFRPWRLGRHHTAHIGIGAFNLVGARMYRAGGGHEAFKMDVLDDVKLGKLMRVQGGRAAFADGGTLVRVRWVDGLAGLIRGLEKNTFAGFQYQPLLAIGGALSVIIMTWVPWITLLSGPFAARLISVIGLVAMFAVGWLFSPEPRGTKQVFGFPIGGMVMAITIVRSMLKTYSQGGIRWRGTHYRLDELRRGIY